MAELPAELAPPDPVPNRETVELFTYFLREFKGFMTHMDAALQVIPLNSAKSLSRLRRRHVRARLRPPL